MALGHWEIMLKTILVIVLVVGAVWFLMTRNRSTDNLAFFHSGIDPVKAIDLIPNHEWSLLVVGLGGRIVDVVGFENVPTTEQMQEFARRFKGSGAVIINKNQVQSQEQLKEKAGDIVRGLKMAKDGILRDGANPIK